MSEEEAVVDGSEAPVENDIQNGDEKPAENGIEEPAVKKCFDDRQI